MDNSLKTEAIRVGKKHGKEVVFVSADGQIFTEKSYADLHKSQAKQDYTKVDVSDTPTVEDAEAIIAAAKEKAEKATAKKEAESKAKADKLAEDNAKKEATDKGKGGKEVPLKPAAKKAEEAPDGGESTKGAEDKK